MSMSTDTAPPIDDVEGVRAYIQDRLSRASVAFTEALRQLNAVSTLPDPLLIIEGDDETDLVEAAYRCELARKALRYWRRARGPEGEDPRPFLQAARQHALEVVMDPDDPTHRIAQELERGVARSFYNNTSDEYITWWLAEGTALAAA